MLFQPLEGDVAVIVERGVFRQCDLYQRAGFLFAKVGSGFVRLHEDGSTSKAHCRLETLATDLPVLRNDLGRLVLPDVAGARPIRDERREMLSLPSR